MMRGIQLLLVLMSLLSLRQSNAQLISFSFGYTGHFTQPDGLNYVVDRYNQTRTSLPLIQEMEHFNNMDGFSFSTFLGASFLGLDFGYDHRSQNRLAIGPNRIGQPLERTLRAAINTANLGLYIAIPTENTVFAFGGKTNIGGLIIKTKLENPASDNKVRWDNVFGEAYADFDLNIKLLNKFLALEAFYTMGSRVLFSDDDMALVNKRLNPDTYQDDPQSIPFRATGFGIKARIALTNAG